MGGVCWEYGVCGGVWGGMLGVQKGVGSEILYYMYLLYLFLEAIGLSPFINGNTTLSTEIMRMSCRI